MPPASVKFIKTGYYNRKTALALAIPGSVALLIAVFLVKSLPLQMLQWIVLLVIFYTSATVFHAVFGKKQA